MSCRSGSCSGTSNSSDETEAREDKQSSINMKKHRLDSGNAESNSSEGSGASIKYSDGSEEQRVALLLLDLVAVEQKPKQLRQLSNLDQHTEE